MNINYLCCRWQGFLEEIVNAVSKGYVYVHLSVLPTNKLEDATNIDKKIIGKYRLEGDTKDKRYHRKKLGLANFRYLRWQHILLILHTEGHVLRAGGTVPTNVSPYFSKHHSVSYDDKFTDIRKSPLKLAISDSLVLNVQFLSKKEKGIQATVRIDKQLMKTKKAELSQFAESRAINKMIYSFNMLNGLPAWRGIIIQKRELYRFIMDLARKHQLKLPLEQFKVKDFRVKETNIYQQKE